MSPQQVAKLSGGANIAPAGIRGAFFWALGGDSAGADVNVGSRLAY